jgi:hypothetical protein
VSSSGSGNNTLVNYVEIYNTINSNLDVLSENASNLLENVLPVFTLPEYTLPNMAVLYAVVTQLQQQQSRANSAATGATSSSGNTNENEPGRGIESVNSEKLLNSIESCIQFADEKQVNRTCTNQSRKIRDVSIYFT